MNIDEHILQKLDVSRGNSRPTTIGDLAREFGISTAVARAAARRLVDNGRAEPVVVNRNGADLLHALRPMSPAGA